MKPLKAMVGGCCVCSDETGWKDNPLVYCDGHGCNVAVHQACYGIISVPSGPWFCRKCESEKPKAQVRCRLCPLKDGALKRTVPEGWCHVLCALYIPEAEFENVETMEPIILKNIRPDRFSKVCCVCEKQERDPAKINWGACIRCHKVGCRQYFHVTCGQSQGLLCEANGGRGGNVKYVAYCLNHLKKMKRDFSVKVIPAFTAVPAESASSDSSPEKRERGPSNWAAGAKTCGKSVQVCIDSTASSTQEIEVQEASSATDYVEVDKPNHRSASQIMRTPKSASSVCSCKQHCTCSENVSLVNSASDSRPGSSANVTSSENVFITSGRNDSLLSSGGSDSGGSGGVFGSAAAVRRDSGCGQQSVIVSGGSDSSNSQSLPSTSVSIQGSSAETAEPTPLYSKSKSAKPKARKRKYSTHFSTKKKPGASKAAREAESHVSRDVTQGINDGMQDLAVSPSASGTSASGGSVFGGDPFFQRPPFLSALPSEGESQTGAPTFVRPLPPADAFSPSLPELPKDNGRVPHSIPELLQIQQDETVQFLLDESSSSEVSQMLQQLHEVKGENRQLEEQVAALMQHRDSLQAITARLALPLPPPPPPHTLLQQEPQPAYVIPTAHLPPSTPAKIDANYIEESMAHAPEAVKTASPSQTTYLSGKQATPPYALPGATRVLEPPSGNRREVTQQQCMASPAWLPSKQPSLGLWTPAPEGATEPPWSPLD